MFQISPVYTKLTDWRKCWGAIPDFISISEHSESTTGRSYYGIEIKESTVQIWLGVQEYSRSYNNTTHIQGVLPVRGRSTAGVARPTNVSCGDGGYAHGSRRPGEPNVAPRTRLDRAERQTQQSIQLN